MPVNQPVDIYAGGEENFVGDVVADEEDTDSTRCLLIFLLQALLV